AQTVVSWSTAWKCSSTLRPDHSAGIRTFRRYHTAAMKSTSPIPDSSDSGQNGTTISPESSASFRPRSRPESPRSISNRQVPFRHSQSSRTNCGRGYSGRGVSEVAGVDDGALDTSSLLTGQVLRFRPASQPSAEASSCPPETDVVHHRGAAG